MIRFPVSEAYHLGDMLLPVYIKIADDDDDDLNLDLVSQYIFLFSFLARRSYKRSLNRSSVHISHLVYILSLAY